MATDPSNVPVFVLCGGLGTRIREETEFRPKPMVPVGNRPIMWHIMRSYASFGFKKFVLCLGYKADVVKSYFLNYASMNSDFTVGLKSNNVTVHSIDHEQDWEVTLADTGELTMTGGRVARAAAKYLGDAQNFAVTYGDGLTDANLADEYAFHLGENRIGTVLAINPPSRFGELRLEGTRCADFNEKPEFAEHWINGGFFFFNRKFLSYVSPEETCVLERDPLAKLTRDGQLSVYQHSGFWACMDTQRDREQLDKQWASGKAPWLPANPRIIYPQGGQVRVFVTGHKGYIGSHLVDLLKQEGHSVTGCDVGLFDGCAWDKVAAPDRDLNKDVRAITLKDLEGHEAVMHLAAISNDPMGELDGGLTYSVNRDASVQIAKLAKQAGVGRYLFAGSCSVYGQGAKPDLDENDPLNPLTAYAKSKIETEQQVSKLADDSFCPVYLRNSTAYGYSPMLRIDLVVNNLLGSAMSYGQIRIQSDGSPWRPLIHCRDIARAFVAMAKAPRDRVFNKAINVGANSENYRVRDVADQVKRLMPAAAITYTGEVGADPRNYRVNFDLLYNLLPDFKLQYNLASGMDELHAAMVRHNFNKKDFEGDQFVRLRTLKHRLNRLQAA